MTEVSIDQLQTTIARMHKCSASLLGVAPVQEVFDGKTVWNGTVHVFTIDHSEAKICYAWTAPIEGTEKRKFYTVLKIPPVNSAQDAVRAAIVADSKRQ